MTRQRRCMSLDASGDAEATKDSSQGLEDEKKKQEGEVTATAEEEAGILSMNNTLKKEK